MVVEVKQALWPTENAEEDNKKSISEEVVNYNLELESLKQKAKNVKKNHHRSQACSSSTTAYVWCH